MTSAQSETRDLTIAQAFDLGCELVRAGRLREAIGLFRGVLIHEPSNADVMQRLGSCLFELKQVHEALYMFWRARKLDRKDPRALSNYGLCLAHLGHMDEGLAELERALAAARRRQWPREGVASLHNNIGNTLERMKHYPQALAALDAGLALNPQDAFAHYNRGIVLLRLNRQEEAVAALDTAIAMNPADADAHYNRGMAQLLLGNLHCGFADYEYRLLTSENEKPNFGLPADKKWTGTADLSGRTVLVYCEQGLGDDIQFFRFLPALASAAKVKLVTHSATRGLLPAMDNLEVLGPGADLGDYDYWIPLMSMPHYLGIESEAQIPPPYRPVIEPERMAKWAEAIGNDGRLRVGVCWAGNFRHKNDLNRSIRFDKFSTLFFAQATRFFSLQQLRMEDEAAFADAEKRGHVARLTLPDFRDTAAAILNLDLVITVDTAVAHLAGSLGVPTWVLLPLHGTDWRWQLRRADTPWYPSLRLVRQQRQGEWSSVIHGLIPHIEDLAKAGRAAA